MRSHLLLALGVVVSATYSGAQTPTRDAMRRFRKAALTRTAANWRLRRDEAFPSTFGLVVDFPVGEVTATLFCLKDGSASLYTTRSFGIVGGGTHPEVRKASVALVKLASRFWSKGEPTRSAAYPANGRVRFTLLGYDGNRAIESTDLQGANRERDRLNPLWIAANRVLTELRTVADAPRR